MSTSSATGLILAVLALIVAGLPLAISSSLNLSLHDVPPPTLQRALPPIVL
jgi:hypothetical protein